MFESLTAWCGILIPLFFMVALLYVIISLLGKGSALPAFFLGIFLLLIIPIWLDQVILYNCYLVIPFESSREPTEWMDFLGSYLGVAGTIVAGALAYWQTKVNRNQDEEIKRQERKLVEQEKEIKDLQNKLTNYQSRPIIVFQSGTLEAYYQGSREEINKDIYRKKSYSICGSAPSRDHSSFIYINIPFQEKGYIPDKAVAISNLEWQIDDKFYNIELDDKKYTILGEQLQILIDGDDKITGSNTIENANKELFEFMMIHQDFFKIGKANFNHSHFKVHIKFINQLELDRQYELDYYIFSEENKDYLSLTDPHINIL